MNTSRERYATPLIISIYGDGDAWPQLLTNRMLWCSLLSVGTHDSYVKCDERMWGEGGRGAAQDLLCPAQVTTSPPSTHNKGLFI